jgi:hypothetical protein
MTEVVKKYQLCLQKLIPYASLMLKDQPPIPQYTVRLFSDIAQISPQFAAFLSKEFSSHNVWKLLIDLLVPELHNNTNNNPGSNHSLEDNDDFTATEDPQVAILLRTLFECSDPNICGLLLDSTNLPIHVASACTIAVFYSPVVTSNAANMESILPLIELLLSLLHFVIRSITSFNATEEKESNTQVTDDAIF